MASPAVLVNPRVPEPPRQPPLQEPNEVSVGVLPRWVPQPGPFPLLFMCVCVFPSSDPNNTDFPGASQPRPPLYFKDGEGGTRARSQASPGVLERSPHPTRLSVRRQASTAKSPPSWLGCRGAWVEPRGGGAWLFKNQGHPEPARDAPFPRGKGDLLTPRNHLQGSSLAKQP